jgi:hypothetical protein
MKKLIGVVSVLALLVAVGRATAGAAFHALSRLPPNERAALTALPDDQLASLVSIPAAATRRVVAAKVRAPEPAPASRSGPAGAGSDRPSAPSGVPVQRTPSRLETTRSEPTRAEVAPSTPPRDVETRKNDPARADVVPTAAPRHPAGAIAAPRPARERDDASEDPGAIIDWLLRQRRR